MYDTGNLLKSLSILKKNKPLKMWTSEDESIHFCWFPEVSPGDSESFHRTDHFGPSPRKNPPNWRKVWPQQPANFRFELLEVKFAVYPFAFWKNNGKLLWGKKDTVFYSKKRIYIYICINIHIIYTHFHKIKIYIHIFKKSKFLYTSSKMVYLFQASYMLFLSLSGSCFFTTSSGCPWIGSGL